MTGSKPRSFGIMLRGERVPDVITTRLNFATDYERKKVNRWEGRGGERKKKRSAREGRGEDEGAYSQDS